MQIAIDAAGFTGAEADELRQAMSAKRSGARMARLRDRLFAGMAGRGITGDAAEEIFAKLSAFAAFGFPESHAVSFAYLVYSSAWLKLHYPAAFCAALLNSQPMGFWAPQSLVADVRRHGVDVRRPHVDVSEAHASLEWGPEGPAGGPVGRPERQPSVRLGIESVRGVGEELALRVAESRPYASIEDLVRRAGPGQVQLEALATAGALEGLPPRSGMPRSCTGATGATGAGGRRAALWAAGAVAQGTADRLPGVITGEVPPPLPELGVAEEVEADLWATGVTVGTTPMELARPLLDELGVVPAAGLADTGAAGDRVLVGGIVTHRQRPDSARGTVFLNLEDDTGMVNVICSAGAWERWRPVARGAPALLVRGRLERLDGVVSVIAEKISPLELRSSTGPPSRDFR